jgi:hypothetical protein
VVTGASFDALSTLPISKQADWSERAALLREKARGLYGNARVSTPAVVSLRVDSFNGTDFTVVKPLLDSNQLVACFPGSINQGGDTGSGFMSWADIYQLQTEGHEIMMKGFDDPTTNGGWSFFLDQIETVEPAGFEAQNIALDAAAQQGIWTGDFDFDDPSKIDGTDAGRAWAANYMAFDGQIIDDYFSGVRSFPISRKYGGFHVTVTDATTLAAAEAPVQAAIAANGYVQCLIHSADLDQSGHLSTANLTSFLSWIAGLRDQGLITVMTSTAAKYAQRGQEINLVQDYSFVQAAQGAANTDWTFNGTPVFGNAGTAHSRGGNRTLVMSGYPSNYVLKQLPAGNLRTLEIGFWAKSSTGNNTKARVLIKQTLPDGSTLAINRDVQWSLTGSTWQHCRAFVRCDPRGGNLTITVFAISATDPPQYSDFLIKAT